MFGLGKYSFFAFRLGHFGWLGSVLGAAAVVLLMAYLRAPIVGLAIGMIIVIAYLPWEWWTFLEWR